MIMLSYNNTNRYILRLNIYGTSTVINLSDEFNEFNECSSIWLEEQRK